MPYKKSYKQTEAKPILTERKGNKSEDLSKLEAVAIGGVVLSALRHGNAIYLQPSRFGTVTVKVYIEGEQFAENLNPGEDWQALCEAIIEALWDIQAVAYARQVFAADAPGATESVGRPRARVKPPEAELP